MIALTPREQEIIKQVIKTHAIDQPYKVVLFGSRSTGSNRKYSDVDLAFIGSGAMPLGITSELDEAFEESDLPYTVDVVDLSSASQALQAEVKQNGIELMRL